MGLARSAPGSGVVAQRGGGLCYTEPTDARRDRAVRGPLHERWAGGLDSTSAAVVSLHSEFAIEQRESPTMCAVLSLRWSCDAYMSTQTLVLKMPKTLSQQPQCHRRPYPLAKTPQTL